MPSFSRLDWVARITPRAYTLLYPLRTSKRTNRKTWIRTQSRESDVETRLKPHRFLDPAHPSPSSSNLQRTLYHLPFLSLLGREKQLGFTLPVLSVELGGPLHPLTEYPGKAFTHEMRLVLLVALLLLLAQAIPLPTVPEDSEPITLSGPIDIRGSISHEVTLPDGAQTMSSTTTASAPPAVSTTNCKICPETVVMGIIAAYALIPLTPTGKKIAIPLAKKMNKALGRDEKANEAKAGAEAAAKKTTIEAVPTQDAFKLVV
jgi:hypothetical protein